nr:MAG TPA: hypothetical protein [Caudoviricetes sp.]
MTRTPSGQYRPSHWSGRRFHQADGRAVRCQLSGHCDSRLICDIIKGSVSRETLPFIISQIRRLSQCPDS